MTLLVFLGSLMGAMGLGMPIAFALIVCSLALMLQIGNFDSQIVAQSTVNGADSFILMAVPFFMLAGEFMNAGGLSRRIVNLASALVGHLRGGLGYVAVFAAIIMASLSGSAVADTAALAALLIPMMRDAKYPIGRSAGLIASGGIIAPVIPPSMGFIVFGVAAQVSITKLFLAGIVPGVLMGLALVIAWWAVCRKDPLATRPRASGAEMLKALRDGIWALVLPFIIIGGLKFGIFTPTEAAVVVAFYAWFIGAVVYRELTFPLIYRSFVNAARMTAIIMFLVAAAMVSAWLIAVADIPAQVQALAAPFIDSPKLLMLVLMFVVVLVGTALDFVPTVLILTPVLMPIVKSAGIDPVYFGVLFIMNNAIGLLTPPVGTVLNVVCGVAKIPMESVIKGVWPFLLAQLFLLGLLIAVPEIVTMPLRWLTMR
ncbi:TRAP transporter large permease subunit [Noviherbaspirillum sp. CPCC 100848]|uniref:TRAP transporter large permease protein n=1 Tax=Noviherbaspirillum album TaxID=3080276 RepID=A0ABU6J9K6_9BURK|nr:TRAP transporter large permease subunit [Noviherbaspirillum sp. CPCC 100848]MEC4720111.1 TRAP transporter large permease subunit [Noviherbaspirillum sp. CPCC 100848]